MTSALLRAVVPIAFGGASLALFVSLSRPPLPSSTAATDASASRPLGRIDFHTHLHPATLDTALQLLDAGGIDLAVNLAPVAGGEALAAYLEMERRAPGRIVTFASVDWRKWPLPDFGARAADELEESVRAGARGLKIPKALGLAVPKASGGLLAIDDPSLDPLFERAGALGVPVAIHVADPAAFWLPVDENNERYDELSLNPGWSYFGADVPSHKELLDAARRRYARHPKTTFVAVHVAGFPEDLAYVSRLLRELPNVYVDIAARVPELGRHPPDEVRAFFVAHQDRVLFGTDLGVAPGGIMLGAPLAWRERWVDVERFFSSTWRFLESGDRGFEHPTPIQGRWRIDGVALPPEVLKKLYRDNAARLLGL